MPPSHRIYGLRRPGLEPIALASLAPGAMISWAGGPGSWSARPTIVVRWPDLEVLLDPTKPETIAGHRRWLVGWARRHGAANATLAQLREIEAIWNLRVACPETGRVDGRVGRFVRRLSRLHGGYWFDGRALYTTENERVAGVALDSDVVPSEARSDESNTT